MRTAQKCPECQTEYERTADNTFSVCPNGHGKLMPQHFSLTEAEQKKLKQEREKSDAEGQDQILTKYGLKQKEP